MPIGGHDLSKADDAVPTACEDIGRDPASVSLGVFGAKPDAESLESWRRRASPTGPGPEPGPRDERWPTSTGSPPLIDAARL
ncbi:MAG: hypothetical protein R2710_29210 [Acidimicrobiales bacterium]